MSFTTIGLGEGLPNGSINAIVRDRTGYMWFATLDGLCRYNGYEFEVFKHDPLDSTSVADKTVAIGGLLVDKGGTLWIGTYSGGLDRFDPATGHFIHYQHDPRNPKSLASNSIRALFEDTRGVLWVGTLRDGLDRMMGASSEFEHFRHDSAGNNSLSDNSVKCICEDSAGGLWIGTREGGVNRLDPESGRFVAYKNVPEDSRSLTQGEVWSVCADADSSVWVGTVSGLNRWERRTNGFTRFAHRPSVSGSLGHDFVLSLALDPHQRLWIGTFGGGLDRFERDTRTFTHQMHDTRNPAGLRSNLIRTIYVDPSTSGLQPSLWIGTEGEGVAHTSTEKKAFGWCRNEPGIARSLLEGTVNAICEDRSGVTWIGTMNGLCRLDSVVAGRACFTRILAHPSRAGGPDNTQVTSLLEDSFGLLWIGTFKGGLDCLDRQRRSFRHFRAASGANGTLSSNSVNTIFQGRDGTLWIGTQRGLDRFDREHARFTHFRQGLRDSTSLSMESVRAILETRDGTLWIGTESGGLIAFDPRTRTFRVHKNDPRDSSSLSNDRVYALYEDAEGSLWVGTSDGLNRMDRTSNRFIHFSKKDGLTSSYIRGIVDDGGGNLWLNTTRGLTRFRISGGMVHTYDVNDGLQGDDLSGAAYRNRSGELMIGGNNGFNVFDPREIVDDSRGPSVVLTSFNIFDKPAPLGRPISAIETIHLAHKENFFSFGFASLDYTNPAKRVYAYVLEGFDPEWVLSGTRRFAYYTNVGPGEYTFRVKGANADGAWGEQVAPVRVIIAPPYWRTWWFITLAALALAGAVAALYNYRVSKLLEMERMRVRISSDLHDDIGSNLSSIALIADMVQNTLPEGTGGRDHLQDVSRTARHTADALKDIVWIISPSHERLDDIILRMKDGAAKLLTGIDYTFDCPVDGLSEHLTMEFRRNLLLMYKETLNNIAKYSRATRVIIAIGETEQMLRMTITDNGVGFDEKSIVPGNGLRNLRQRAATLGGNVTVRSAPGQGTVVEFHVRIP